MKPWGKIALDNKRTNLLVLMGNNKKTVNEQSIGDHSIHRF